MIDADILRALNNAIKIAVSLSLMPELPIAFPDVTFDPPNDGKYIEVVFIPNNRNNDYWGDEKNYQGLYRIILHWPKGNEGSYKPMNVLSSVCGYFTKGLAIDPVKITSLPNFMGSLVNQSETLYPASLEYQRFFG